MKLARQIAQLGTETAFAVSAQAAHWQQRGNRVFPFHLGDIDLPPPAAIVDAVNRAIRAGKNGYCPGAGTPLLREQLARVISEERNISYTADNVAVQPGGKPVIAKFLATVMNPGDEVLYPVPGFPIYESQIRYQGGQPIPYYYRSDADGFSLDIDRLKNAITPRTKALIFNDYHNPTGSVATATILDAIAQLAEEHNLWLLADEAYFAIRYNHTPNQSILTRPGALARSVLLFTCSKQFAMTGWRLGAALGPVPVIEAITKINTNLESCTTHFIQHAVGEVLQRGPVDNDYILTTLNERRQRLVARLNAIEGITVSAPKSGFYVYCDVANIIQRKRFNSVDELMRETLWASGVSFCTGAHFGEAESSSHIRFAFSGISAEAIDKGMVALKDYFEV